MSSLSEQAHEVGHLPRANAHLNQPLGQAESEAAPKERAGSSFVTSSVRGMAHIYQVSPLVSNGLQFRVDGRLIGALPRECEHPIVGHLEALLH